MSTDTPPNETQTPQADQDAKERALAAQAAAASALASAAPQAAVKPPANTERSIAALVNEISQLTKRYLGDSGVGMVTIAIVSSDVKNTAVFELARTPHTIEDQDDRRSLEIQNDTFRLSTAYLLKGHLARLTDRLVSQLSKF